MTTFFFGLLMLTVGMFIGGLKAERGEKSE
jgi:hypothetical protein